MDYKSFNKKILQRVQIFFRCKLSHAEKTLAEFIFEHRDEAKKKADSILFFKKILLIEERLHKFTSNFFLSF